MQVFWLIPIPCSLCSCVLVPVSSFAQQLFALLTLHGVTTETVPPGRRMHQLPSASSSLWLTWLWTTSYRAVSVTIWALLLPCLPICYCLPTFRCFNERVSQACLYIEQKILWIIVYQFIKVSGGDTKVISHGCHSSDALVLCIWVWILKILCFSYKKKVICLLYSIYKCNPFSICGFLFCW